VRSFVHTVYRLTNLQALDVAVLRIELQPPLGSVPMEYRRASAGSSMNKDLSG